MKRFYALLLSVILIVTLSLSALAAPSPAKDPAPKKQETATWSPGPVTAVDVASVAGMKATGMADSFANHVADLLDNKDGFVDTYNIPAEAKVAAFFNLTFDGEIPAGGLIVPITVNNAEPGDYVIVMHRRADGIWEVVARGFLGEDLTIDATFTSFSPVLVLVVDAAYATAVGIKAPKTGQ